MASNNLAIGAEALLKAGARWDVENNSGERVMASLPCAPSSKLLPVRPIGDTPLMTAQMSSAHDVVEVLRRYGAQY